MPACVWKLERAMWHDVCRCADGWSRHAQWQDQFDQPRCPPIFRLKKKFRIRLLIRGPKTLKLQNSLAIIIPKFKFLSGIKLSVDVDPISFN